MASTSALNPNLTKTLLGRKKRMASQALRMKKGYVGTKKPKAKAKPSKSKKKAKK